LTISQGLSDRQKAVVATMRMRLTWVQALAYMKGEGYPMGQATYGRIKAYLKRTQLERLHYIAAIGFEQQHLERIDTCELMAQLHWQNYHLEKNPYKKSMILREIRELQPYISAYYDATRKVIQKSEPPTKQQEQSPENPIGISGN
jgi:hypothetical protein